MDQILIGSYIAQKRKEKNMTQAKLAERLGVSNKTVSKWETGKCMPDYSVIEPLCSELGITVAELMDGENAADNSVRTYDEAQILDLIKRTQMLEKDKNIPNGILLIVMGIALLFLYYCVGGDEGSNVMDFISGVPLGISIPVMLAGIYVAVRGAAEKQPSIIVSGGKIGSQIEVAPGDLVRAAEAEFADLIKQDECTKCLTFAGVERTCMCQALLYVLACCDSSA
ncbi:MAG: helix-turn-helix domain-containing protein [Lachnospiraceae bacterium]|nr:helix-turn-helix domain-containing protein [Lachnospiraceae bacterium]